MIGLVCSACGKNLKVKEENAGKRVKCPGCGQLMQVPAVGRDALAAAANEPGVLNAR